jgi:hypothetical protein
MNACMLCPSQDTEESELREPVPRQTIFMLNGAISGQSPRTGQKAIRPALPPAVAPEARRRDGPHRHARHMVDSPRYDGIQSPADQGA